LVYGSYSFGLQQNPIENIDFYDDGVVKKVKTSSVNFEKSSSE
jgi:hypothetical protein